VSSISIRIRVFAHDAGLVFVHVQRVSMSSVCASVSFVHVSCPVFGRYSVRYSFLRFSACPELRSTKLRSIELRSILSFALFRPNGFNG